MLEKLKTDFLIHIREKGFVTKKTQKMFSGLGYYLMIWALRDRGWIREDGFNESREKIWRLTPKGNEISRLLVERKNIYEKTLKAIEEKIDRIVGGV